jgi:hypothetical protein
VKQRTWSSGLVQAVERLRLDFPMWGRAKIGPLVRAEGFAASDSTVGRIIAHLVSRGVVQPVPTLRGLKLPEQVDRLVGNGRLVGIGGVVPADRLASGLHQGFRRNPLPVSTWTLIRGLMMITN